MSMKTSTRLVLVLLAAVILSPALFARDATTVLLVRHAEKATTSGSDPELTDEGMARAEALAVVLADVEITAIYSTSFKRTEATAAPTAAKTGIATTVVEVGPTFIKDLADRILETNRGETVLVVGHSNTIGATLAALGAGPPFDLEDHEYGDLFICTIPDKGEPSVIRLNF